MAITLEKLEAKIREQAGEIAVLLMNAQSYLDDNEALRAELAALTTVAAPAKRGRRPSLTT